ncbi:class I SAM-dependent methyltransferase [Candidatus Woesearchaeota archaeon]|nr:class I SAM-dependent methyltransferase [Candidatus Woesearchaeota archaeon]
MRAYKEWGALKLRIDALEPTHYIRNHLVLKTIQPLASAGSSVRIADVRCESGYLAHALAQLGYTLTAVDVSNEAIALAQQSYTHPRLRFSQGDARSLSGTYDIILAIESLNRVNNDVEYLKQCGKKLAPKGLLILTVPAHEEYRSDFDNRIGNIRRYSAEELSKKLQRSGFRVKSTHYYGYPLLHWYYFHVYLKASLKRRHLQRRKQSFFWQVLPLINKIFLYDLRYNDSRAINLLIVAEKT